MGRITAFIYGAASYLLMFVTFLYLFGFLANLWVPKGVDDGVVGSFALALAVNIGLIVLFGVQHSVMARPGFKKWWTSIIPKPIERSTYVLISTVLFILLFWAWQPMTDQSLFGWLQALYPRWTANIDEEAENSAAWVGLAELALSGCSTSTDHHYLHPARAGDLLAAEIEAASDLGMRFHPTYGSMSLSVKDGGLPPDDAVRDEDDILAESERHVARWHDPSHGSMVQIALAPCSPFTVTPRLMRQTAELAEQLDVRLHTHLAENSEDDEFAIAQFGMRPVDLYDALGEMGGLFAQLSIEVDRRAVEASAPWRPGSVVEFVHGDTA